MIEKSCNKASFSNGRSKKRFVFKKKAQPNLTHAMLARLYGIKENTVSTILKNPSSTG